jgi:hypothetical protein
MSGLNEERGVLLTRNLDERKKGRFLSHFSDSRYYSILQQISLFHNMVNKLQQGYSVCKFQPRQRTSRQKKTTRFLKYIRCNNNKGEEISKAGIV